MGPEPSPPNSTCHSRPGSSPVPMRGLAGHLALQRQGARSDPFCPLHRSLSPFLLALSTGHRKPPPRTVFPGCRTTGILPCPLQTCPLPLQHGLLLLLTAAPVQQTSLEPGEHAQSLVCSLYPRRKRNWLEFPAETESQGRSLHSQAARVIWPRASLQTAFIGHSLFSPNERNLTSAPAPP